MRDSPRWCVYCQSYGDHHTDRCPHWVLGWGRTKHIADRARSDALGRPRGLCGAFGGNLRATTKERPTCKHCERMAS